MCHQLCGTGRVTVLESSNVASQALPWSVCTALEVTGRLQYCYKPDVVSPQQMLRTPCNAVRTGERICLFLDKKRGFML